MSDELEIFIIRLSVLIGFSIIQTYWIMRIVTSSLLRCLQQIPESPTEFRVKLKKEKI